MPLPPAAGERLAFANVLYSAPTPLDSFQTDCQSAAAGTAPALAPVFAMVFAELCTPIAHACAASPDFAGIRWPALRLYTNASRDDCLDAVAVGPGSAIEFRDGHPSLILQERSPRVVAFKSSQQAALWASLLRDLCALDPLDLEALANDSPRLLAMAEAAEAAAASPLAGAPPLLRVTDRSPFLPCKPSQLLATSEPNSPAVHQRHEEEEGFDVAAALMECGNVMPRPSDTCDIARPSDTCDVAMDGLSGSCDTVEDFAVNALFGRSAAG